MKRLQVTETILNNAKIDGIKLSAIFDIISSEDAVKYQNIRFETNYDDDYEPLRVIGDIAKWE
jgi:hypothetical protein